jgi:hypothetical protein
MFEFSNRRFLVVGSEAACPEIAQNLSPWFELIIVPIRYLKLCTTNQQKLACSWPSHHYLCANYSPCKPAKLVAHQFLQGWSCCKILSYGVKCMAPCLTVLLSAMPSPCVSHSQSSQPFFFYFQNTMADLAF